MSQNNKHIMDYQIHFLIKSAPLCIVFKIQHILVQSSFIFRIIVLSTSFQIGQDSGYPARPATEFHIYRNRILIPDLQQKVSSGPDIRPGKIEIWYAVGYWIFTQAGYPVNL